MSAVRVTEDRFTMLQVLDATLAMATHAYSVLVKHGVVCWYHKGQLNWAKVSPTADDVETLRRFRTLFEHATNDGDPRQHPCMTDGSLDAVRDAWTVLDTVLTILDTEATGADLSTWDVVDMFKYERQEPVLKMLQRVREKAKEKTTK